MKTGDLARLLSSFDEIQDMLRDISDTYRNEKNFQSEQYKDIHEIDVALIDVMKRVINHFVNY